MTNTYIVHTNYFNCFHSNAKLIVIIDNVRFGISTKTVISKTNIKLYLSSVGKNLV